MVKEFRDFLFQGNIIELAVAVVIAAAFGQVVNAMVADLITPLISLLGVPDFSTWTITLTGLNESTATFAIGDFFNALLSFVIVAAAIFFIVIKPMNAMTARLKGPGEDAPPEPTEVELLRDIRDALTSQGRSS